METKIQHHTPLCQEPAQDFCLIAMLKGIYEAGSMLHAL